MPVTVLAPAGGDALVEESLELLAAFSQISDPRVRRTVIAMVQGLRPSLHAPRRETGGLTVSVRGRAPLVPGRSRQGGAAS